MVGKKCTRSINHRTISYIVSFVKGLGWMDCYISFVALSGRVLSGLGQADMGGSASMGLDARYPCFLPFPTSVPLLLLTFAASL